MPRLSWNDPAFTFLTKPVEECGTAPEILGYAGAPGRMCPDVSETDTRMHCTVAYAGLS
jgi:hypothetical protein